MIELVSAARCTGCDICVEVCPTRVFDAVPDAPPVIARPSSCQTCFMCELYCPADALNVAPEAQATSAARPDEHALIASGRLGSYRRAVGWHERDASTARQDLSWQLLASVR